MSNREVIERAFRQWRYESLREGRFPDCYRPHDVVEAVLMAWHLAKDPRRYQRWRAYWQRQKRVRYAKERKKGQHGKKRKKDQPRAPKGGTTIGGKPFDGGEYIPKPTHDTIRELVEEVIEQNHPERGKKRFWVDLGTLSQQVVEKIKEATGYDLTDYRATVDDSAVGHMFKRHGPEKERRGDQIPITKEDIEKIPEIINNSDKIFSETHAKRLRLPGIVFVKRINGTIYYVALVRKGKGELAAHTMWKTKT